MQISTHQQKYIHEGMKMNIRTDGRGCGDFREYYIQTGNLIQADGSSIVKIPDSDTTILIGIKSKVCDSQDDQGFIQLKLDCLQKKQRENININITQMELIIQEFIVQNLNKKQLIIINKKKAWKLFVDIFILQFNMAIMDAIVFGIKGAFLNLKLPKLVVTKNIITGEDIIDLLDEKITTFNPFDMKGFPLICTVGEVENQLIIDLSTEECLSVDSYYVVCFDEDNNLMGIRKFGDQSLRIENINKILSLSIKFGINLNEKFKKLQLS